MAGVAQALDSIARFLGHLPLSALPAPSPVAARSLAEEIVRRVRSAAQGAPATATAITRGAGGPPVGYVIAASVTSRGPRILDFTDGSFWLVGAQLDPALPPDSLVGAAYSTASLVIGHGPPFEPVPRAGPLTGAIVIPDDVTAQLTMHPGTTAAPAGPVDDDGAVATVTPPVQARFEFAPDSTSLTLLGDAVATVYGSTVTFGGGAAGTRPDTAGAQWVVSYTTISPEPIDFGSSRSRVFVTSGAAAPSAGDWRLPVVRVSPDRLGAAAEGALGITAGPGLSAASGRHTAPFPLAGFDLAVRNGWLQLTSDGGGGRPFVDTYELWDAGTPGHPRPTSIAVRGNGSGTVVSTQSAALDSVEFSGCTVAAHIDRPCLVDGSQPRLGHLSAQYFVRVDADGPGFAVIASGPPGGGGATTESYLLENALLRTPGVAELAVVGRHLAGSTAVDGTVILGAPLGQLTPTLPDPYAASLADVSEESRVMAGIVQWASTGGVTLTFEFLPGGGAAGQGATTLYDVSGACDQFGVSMSPDTLGSAQIDGQTLTVPGASSALFALPGIAWEAVASVDSAGNRVVFRVFAADDGPSVTVNVPTQHLRPMTPDAFLAQFLTDYAAGGDLIAGFTLPFGLEAEVFTPPSQPPSPAARPTLGTESPGFGTLTGGRQLSVAAPRDPFTRAILPGRSLTTVDRPDIGYPAGILGQTVADFWNRKFSQPGPNREPFFVPLARVAISGYGTSLFSDYTDPIPVGVSEARFDVLVGRTAYTLVQVRSVLAPWRVLVVNTTVFERDGAGWVQRRNTGWQAQSVGLFEFSGGTVERGGCASIVNVRNITDLRLPPVQVGTKEWLQVGFDADVALVTSQTDPNGLRITGGDIGNGRIAGRDFTGWIDLTVTPSSPPEDDVPTLGDVVALMDAVRSAGGSVTAEIVAGATRSGPGATPGIAMTLNGLDVAATNNPGARTLGVALRGLPHLPRDGSWSVARRSSVLHSTPRPVDPLTPVPLIRSSGDPVTWHIAEPTDVLNLANPATLYSIVQSTGTQQLLFEHPTIAGVAGQNPLTFTQQPALADVGALLGSGGLLPDLSSLLRFDSFTGFAPVGDGLGASQSLTKTIQLPDTTLIPLGPITVLLGTNLDRALPPPGGTPPNQSVVTVVIDPAAAPRWSVTITNVAFKLAIDGMGDPGDPVVAVVGDFAAADGQAPTLKNVKFGYGTALSTVQKVLSGIQAIADTLPGGGASGLHVAFTGTKLRIRDAVSLPLLPLGPGYIEGISLDVGFDLDVLAKTMTFTVGLGTDQDPFTWLASPLAGNGLLQLGATDAGRNVRMQAGLGVGLGIDVAIASGSASVCLAVQLDTTRLPFGVTVLLTGSASVDVLDGLASASLTLTAGVGVVPHPAPLALLAPPPSEDNLKRFIAGTSVTLSAEVAVAIHLTVGWLVHVDWSGSWGFSETVSGSALTSLLP